ncbi:MAG: class I SAM-dependent methyltransferase, partial [Pseudomonadota bacterium]
MANKHKRKRTADTVDRHVLYQQSVQSPEFELDFMHKVFKACRNRAPRSMREDFCGTALASAQWVQRHRDNTAVGVDLDGEVLDWGREHNVAKLKRGQRDRIALKQQNVLDVRTSQRFDMIQALNFSYWILMERDQLLTYFKRVHKTLKRDGVLFLDAFGGYAAHQTGVEKREVDGFVYEWEQATFNPVTNRMQCYIHFVFKDKSRLQRAYSYAWR